MRNPSLRVQYRASAWPEEMKERPMWEEVEKREQVDVTGYVLYGFISSKYSDNPAAKKRCC